MTPFAFCPYLSKDRDDPNICVQCFPRRTHPPPYLSYLSLRFSEPLRLIFLPVTKENVLLRCCSFPVPCLLRTNDFRFFELAAKIPIDLMPRFSANETHVRPTPCPLQDLWKYAPLPIYGVSFLQVVPSFLLNAFLCVDFFFEMNFEIYAICVDLRNLFKDSVSFIRMLI
ncbi:hypothetical protein BO82DRAFT_186638 [Aspergillus uvarum CBS 121591]|uniref:Uncharacterized protein n=1 Tax=Aspergillus uvarum CBS 121591 TaxID=1448315 RepID=A0A319C0K9_9EURO|nr:hypothetical protein BO82DRAFT_186638 [Aspergillus uvarum CBS 121591]PYH77310.1 hypothetical protein BO82DRAFT_186638 [Aspergillus uvarum CBS 121591]